MKDGWKKMSDCTQVFVENGMVVRAMTTDRNGSYVPAAVYKWLEKEHAWSGCMPIKYETFLKGYKEDRYEIH